MLVADICTKAVVTCVPEDRLLDAARKMRDQHVGAVVVVEHRDVVTVNAGVNVDRALEIMSEAGVRRAPVVDGRGALVGIVTVDDLIETLAARLIGVVAVIRKQQIREQREHG